MAEHEHVHGHEHQHDHSGHGHGPDHEHHQQPGVVGDATVTAGDEAEKEERGEQTVKVEDVGPARKCLTIEVPAERIAKKLETGFKKLKTDAQVPGFRKGRAPLRLVQKKFGETIRDDVRARLLGECYDQAIEEQKLEVLGEPEVKDADDIKLPDSGPLVFKVEVEVAPSFELPALDGIEVKKPKMELTDADVEKEVKRLCERFGKMTHIDDAPAQEDDYLLADVRIVSKEPPESPESPEKPAADEKATDEKAKDEKAKSDPAALEGEVAHYPSTAIHVTGKELDYKGHVAGILIDDLGKKLTGQKPGQTVTIDMTGPAGHEDEKIKNKPITLHIRIDRIERLEPAAVDALPGQLGLANLDEVKGRLKEILAERNERSQKSAMREQVCEYLLAKSAMELPEGLSRRQTARLLQRQAIELAYRGVPEKEIEQHIAELRARSEDAARKELKLYFLLDKAAKELKVEVTEMEVNGAIAGLAMQQGRRPEKLRQDMQRRGQVEQVYVQVRDQKTLDQILEKAKVTESAEPAAEKPAAEKPAAEKPVKGKKKK